LNIDGVLRVGFLEVQSLYELSHRLAPLENQREFLGSYEAVDTELEDLPLSLLRSRRCGYIKVPAAAQSLDEPEAAHADHEIGVVGEALEDDVGQLLRNNQDLGVASDEPEGHLLVLESLSQSQLADLGLAHLLQQLAAALYAENSEEAFLGLVAVLDELSNHVLQDHGAAHFFLDRFVNEVEHRASDARKRSLLVLAI